MTSSRPSPAGAPIEVTAHDLQGQGVIACPNPKMALWSNHPKVFLDVVSTGSVTCPYCSTAYRLKSGESVRAH